jgi:APA family basic amino acid/polyamine antiporter
VMTGARVCYAMAEDGVLWKKLGAVHPRFATPYVAITVQGSLACLLVLVGTFSKLLACVVFAMMLSCIATGVAHIKLRIQRRDAERPYRTLGYPLTPLLFVAAYVWFAVLIAVENPVTSAIGIGLALTGLPFYFLRKRRGSGRQSH